MNKVFLGNTNIKISKIGFGTGTFGSDGTSMQTKLGSDKLIEMIYYGYTRGINFIDTADVYGCHRYIAKLLEKVERKKLVLCTKTDAKNVENLINDFERFLFELNVDYIDILLLHYVIDINWLHNYSDLINVLNKFKKLNKVSAVGISCHNNEVLEKVIYADWLDVIMTKLNYAGSRMNEHPEKIVKTLMKIKQLGKGTIVMKVLGNGELSGNVNKSIKYINTINCVDSMVIGMKEKNEIDQNINAIKNNS